MSLYSISGVSAAGAERGIPNVDLSSFAHYKSPIWPFRAHEEIIYLLPVLCELLPSAGGTIVAYDGH